MRARKFFNKVHSTAFTELWRSPTNVVCVRKKVHVNIRVVCTLTTALTIRVPAVPLVGVGNSVHRISNTRAHTHTHSPTYVRKGAVCSSGSTWEDITISLGRPLSGSGAGFALDSHSATKVDRRTLFYEDGWRGFRSFLRPASGRHRLSRKKVEGGRRPDEKQRDLTEAFCPTVSTRDR